jgi:hypothetical protein
VGVHRRRIVGVRRTVSVMATRQISGDGGGQRATIWIPGSAPTVVE